MSQILTTSNLNAALSDALGDHRNLIEQNAASIKAQSESIKELEKSFSESSEEMTKFSGKVDGIEEEVNRILKMLGEMQVSS